MKSRYEKKQERRLYAELLKSSGCPAHISNASSNGEGIPDGVSASALRRPALRQKLAPKPRKRLKLVEQLHNRPHRPVRSPLTFTWTDENGNVYWESEVTQVHPRSDYTILVKFGKTVKGVFDMWPLIQCSNGDFYESLKDLAVFMHCYVCWHTVCWSEEIDIAPNYLYTNRMTLAEYRRWTKKNRKEISKRGIAPQPSSQV